MTTAIPDDHLDRCTALMTVFKNPILAKCCSAICAGALATSGEFAGYFWPDNVHLVVEKKDAACIGIAYRILSRTLKCIERVHPVQVRSSKAEGRRGGMVCHYRVTDAKLCGQIARLEWNPQGELL